MTVVEFPDETTTVPENTITDACLKECPGYGVRGVGKEKHKRFFRLIRNSLENDIGPVLWAHPFVIADQFFIEKRADCP